MNKNVALLPIAAVALLGFCASVILHDMDAGSQFDTDVVSKPAKESFNIGTLTDFSVNSHNSSESLVTNQGPTRGNPEQPAFVRKNSSSQQSFSAQNSPSAPSFAAKVVQSDARWKELEQTASSSGSYASGSSNAMYSNFAPEPLQAGEMGAQVVQAQELPVKMPLAFVDLKPEAKLDQHQAKALKLLQDSFTETVGGPNQNPSDSAYRKRWQQTQPDADDLFRLWFGSQAYMSQQYKAYVQAEAGQ